MAYKTDLEKISDIQLNDIFFILIERMGLIPHYFLEPDKTKSYYDRLIIINREKPSLEVFNKEVVKYKNELLDLEKEKIKILHNKQRG